MVLIDRAELLELTDASLPHTRSLREKRLGARKRLFVNLLVLLLA